MTLRQNTLLLILILATVILSFLYLWFTVFPGKIDPWAFQVFGTAQADKGRAYSLIPQLAYILSFLTQVIFLGWFIFSGQIHNIANAAMRISRGKESMSILIVFITIWLILKLLSFPFNFLSDYYWQHLWGLTNQSFGAWWIDDLKNSILDLGLSFLGVILLFGMFKQWPKTWWMVGAAVFSGWLVIQTLLWPVVISPLFNHFTEVRDPQIISMVNDLAQNAGLRIDKILVMDASRRTNKANAYFTGVGTTQRIVLYDTLFKDYDQNEIQAVIAHEMAHWKYHHILKGLLLGVIGSILFWKISFLVLNSFFPSGKYSPEAWPLFLFLIFIVSFLSNPLQNYVSRQMETQADIEAVQLTKDVQSTIRLQIDLATRNLSDVSPPSFIEWFGYTHPQVLTRVKTVEEWVKK
ncbi:M48 family metallopeptidase [Desulfitobacterium sp. Sab5]|uniref:M48 family metallopeptidase n=1 Tax=Desulfitobacterium nosdiversum TaxID=3375356 RepID=UPI003CF4B707